MEDAASGKAAAKAELRTRMELSSADMPLVAVVTRLTHQKGIHLIKHAAWRTLERGAQFVLLGSAPDPRVQVGLAGSAHLVWLGCESLDCGMARFLSKCHAQRASSPHLRVHNHHCVLQRQQEARIAVSFLSDQS